MAELIGDEKINREARRFLADEEERGVGIARFEVAKLEIVRC